MENTTSVIDWNAQLVDQVDRHWRASCVPGWRASPMAALVLHINRELLHHGAEIAVLRDLYSWREA